MRIIYILKFSAALSFAVPILVSGLQGQSVDTARATKIVAAALEQRINNITVSETIDACSLVPVLKDTAQVDLLPVVVRREYWQRLVMPCGIPVSDIRPTHWLKVDKLVAVSDTMYELFVLVNNGSNRHSETLQILQRPGPMWFLLSIVSHNFWVER